MLFTAACDCGKHDPMPPNPGHGGASGKGSSGSSGSSGGGRGGTAGKHVAGSGGAGGASGTGEAGGAGESGSAGAGGGLRGPLKVSENPRYFADRDGKALILVGSHTWNDLQDWGAKGVPQPFDFDAYTSFLVKHGHNFTLLWRTELPKFCALPTTASAPPDLTTDLQPWPRTGPGKADDGGLKFDLSRFDAKFFDRLRSRVSKLNEAGIWVGVYLFSGEWLSAFRCSGDGHPLTGANNVNLVDDGGGNGAMSMTSPTRSRTSKMRWSITPSTFSTICPTCCGSFRRKPQPTRAGGRPT